jgi:hypothetical protein
MDQVPSSALPPPNLPNQPTAPVPSLNAPDNRISSMPESIPSPTNGTTGFFTECLSFRDQDEFFHCMLSYRVNSEGPWESKDKSGNDLARLIWKSCSTLSISKSQNRDAPLTTDSADKSNHQFLDAIERFGKWPKVFPNATSPVRVFLDQMNLRAGVDWKGTGNREDGGFLGALSSSLMIAPLLSATPVRFKIEPTGEQGRFRFLGPVNITIPKEGESLEIFCDSSATVVITIPKEGESSESCDSSADVAVAQQIDAKLSYTCTEFRSDGVNDRSFILKSTSGGQTVKSVSSTLFWTPKCILPSDGSGPRGSVSEMLTIMQSENLTFRLVERDSSEIVLEVDQLSDHVFFKGETILLHLERDILQPVGAQSTDTTHALSIERIKVQGCIIAGIHSILVVKCGIYSNEPTFLGATASVDQKDMKFVLAKDTALKEFILARASFRGTTVAADRKDNVLMEFMLARALHLAFKSDTNPHPCKLVMPIFVDDLDVVFAVLQRLSTEVSNKTATAVQDSLEKILMRKLSKAEEQKWIRVSVKSAVQFMADLQGLQLSNRANVFKSMEAKAELACNSIISTIGIEAEMYCLEQYVSNNPVAHELLDFIKKENIGHVRPSLVKSAVTSLKIFSQLSSESIKLIAQDSREVSKKPLVREIADIEIAVQAAKASPYILPVSQRLAKFHDEDASFMTIIYSTFAMEQGLLKPFFGKFIMGVLTIAFALICALQFYQQEYIFAVVNLPRAVMSFSIMYCTHVLESVQLGRLAMIIGFYAQALATIVGVLVIDKIRNGKFVWNSPENWNYSFFCTMNYDISKMSTCVLYTYVYGFWQAFIWFVLATFIIWRQEFAWRWWNVGCSVATFLSLSFLFVLGSPGSYDYLGVVTFPVLLIGTESLKLYGTLQAIRLTKGSKIVLSRVWRKIKEGDKETGSLPQLAEFVMKACHRSPFVLDRSKDLGKWTADHVAVEPPLIHQPTSDFDELYGRAVSFNDVFQLWIESFFTRKGDPSKFVYISKEDTKPGQFVFRIPDGFAETLLPLIAIPGKVDREPLPFKGDADRGPVKRPHRSIAKVSVPAADVFNNNARLQCAPGLPQLPPRRDAADRLSEMRRAICIS